MRKEILIGGIIFFILGASVMAGFLIFGTCPDCDGDGERGIWPLEITCPGCDGSGLHPVSEIGMIGGGMIALLGFILIITGVVMPDRQIQSPPHPQSQQPTPVYIQPPASQPLQTPTSPPQQSSQEPSQISRPFFCRKCGKQIEDNAEFCTWCGESIGGK